MSGILTLHIIYGKDRREIKDAPGCLEGILCLLNLAWIFSFLSLFFEDITVLHVVALISYPVAIAIWAIVARKRYREVEKFHADMDSAAKKDKEEKCRTEELDAGQPDNPVRKKGKYLTCPACGRTQLSNRTDCWNCKRVFEEQDYEYIEQKPVRTEPRVPLKTEKKYIVCPSCGKTQLSNRADCWNCKKVFEKQDYE